MIRTAIKWLLIGAVAFAGYKGFEAYAVLNFGENIEACGLNSRVCPLVGRSADEGELGAALHETMACVRSKQSFLESLVLPLGKLERAPEAARPSQAAALCGVPPR